MPVEDSYEATDGFPTEIPHYDALVLAFFCYVGLRRVEAWTHGQLVRVAHRVLILRRPDDNPLCQVIRVPANVP